MNTMPVIFETLHLIRPWWLLLLPLIGLCWWRARRGTGRGHVPTDALASHLRDALTIGKSERCRFFPVDGIAIALVLVTLAAAGPSWTRVPDPWVAQTAPMVIVLKVTPSMEGTDIAPTRLQRARQKIRDLLELRAGARTALVAYAGTAHRVVPMTDDPQVVQPYLDGLEPDVMPNQGEDAGAALAIAADILSNEARSGGVLFVLDSLATADLPVLNGAEGVPIAFLEILPEGVSDPGLDQVENGELVRVTADDGDVRAIERALNRAYELALARDGNQPWDDRGWMLAWPAALLFLFWFRRGWTMRWGAPLALVVALVPGGPARAEGMADWFFTADQQGRIAFHDKDYTRAAERFTDPVWQGYALYKDGQYEQAARVFGRIETAAGAFAQGMASIKGRQYRDGVRAFETALDRDPDYPGAAANLAVAREIVEYVETTREQSDTGEESGIGADDVVLDNEAARGAETQIETEEQGDKLLSTDQWMTTVDTRTGDFLRQRFAIEAAKNR